MKREVERKKKEKLPVNVKKDAERYGDNHSKAFQKHDNKAILSFLHPMKLRWLLS